MSEKKKILLVVRWPVGGIRTFIRYVYLNFDPSKWQFSIIAPDLPEMRILLDEDLAGLDFRFIPVDKRPSIIKLVSVVFRELKANQYSLVHSHGFTSGLCAALPARILRTKHLLTSHDVINKNQFVGLVGKIKKLLVSKTLHLIDKIQSVSHDAQANLLENFPVLGRDKKKCIVITNGIEVERFLQAEPRDLRGELGLDGDRFLIGFLGRFMSQKGFKYLIEAIELLSAEKNLPKRPIVLTFGDGGFIEHEKKAVQDKGLGEYFHFLPFASNVASSIKGLDIIVMPSLWEACPLQPMEALVCGLPFIGTNCVGLSEVLENTPSVMVPTANSDALAEALKNEMIHCRKGSFTQYIETACDRFDVKSRASELENVYLNLCEIR